MAPNAVVYAVVPHPSGGWTPLTTTIAGGKPTAVVTDPAFPDPWLALEHVAYDNRDKIFAISPEFQGQFILGDLNDIANGVHRAAGIV